MPGRFTAAAVAILLAVLPGVALDDPALELEGRLVAALLWVLAPVGAIISGSWGAFGGFERRPGAVLGLLVGAVVLAGLAAGAGRLIA